MYTDKRMNAAEAGKLEAVQESGIMQFYRGLQQYCRFLTQSSWDGDDLVQEVMVKAIPHYEPSQISSALLKKIAYHHWVDTIRKQSREITGLPENLASCTPGSVRDTVEMVISNLTPKQAVIFILNEAFHFKSREIADLMGSTEMAVKASIHRARKRLQREGSLREVGQDLDEDEEKLLSDLLCESLQSEDPTVLLENIQEFPSLASCSPQMSLHSRSPLSSFKMAA
ncbi:RNA polymerase subunit sigma [Mesobacillus subterraneus]|uniref:sigma factor-like helix-turn-helix DNA-binding protein n=1 Tax=Mesobacillus subterraneus TaxID=285983 RepID=UPI00203FFEE6|nr:sigma factor-like helix-turn-helix DNA-binding protein [Mesobacillus subterraneus]MCM3666082.1 RNA polymerase subunit sigma [Mesobacillus subterraneus]MCM3685080.1 RNA polymerase subunit sigma [Mesobacillus subterraneus]